MSRLVRRRRRSEGYDDRREEILRVALKLFSAKGTEGAGLREIAERIGVSQPALYHYFPSKDALVDGVIDWWRARAAARQAAVSQRLAGVRSLREGLEVIADSLLHLWHSPEHEDFHRLIFAEITRRGPLAARLEREFIGPTLGWAEGLFSRLVEVGKVRGLDPDLLALQFIAPILLMGLWQQRHAGEGARERIAQLRSQLIEVFARTVGER